MTEGRTMKGGVYAKPEGPRPEFVPGLGCHPPTQCGTCEHATDWRPAPRGPGFAWGFCQKQKSNVTLSSPGCPYWKVQDLREPKHWAEINTNHRGISESRPLGKKFDDAKPRWSLLPAGTIAQIIAVLEYGAKKYDADNWQQVPHATVRYYDAMMRHVHAWRDGEPCDKESGLHHLAHAACCALFLLWFEMRRAKEISTPPAGQISTSVPPELVGQGQPTGGSDS